MSVRLVVRGPEFMRRLRAGALAAVKEAALETQTAAQDRLNTLYPPASSKGESPRRRSGDGRRSVFAHAEETFGTAVGRCGTTSERLREQGRGDFNYMAYHERSGRPWLLPALLARRSQIAEAARRAFVAAFNR